MRLNKYLFIMCLAGISLSACQQRYFYAEAFKEPTDEIVTEEVRIQTRFGSDAGDFLIFEIDIENQSDQEFSLSYHDLLLRLDDATLSRPLTFPALASDDLIDDLNQERDVAHRQRKTRNLINAVSIGVSVIAVAASPGSYSSGNAFYLATDAAASYFEDRRSYSLIEGSIEEQIAYLEEWVLDEIILQPGEKGSWDILFERILAEHHAELVVQLPGRDRKHPYQLTIQSGTN